MNGAVHGALDQAVDGAVTGPGFMFWGLFVACGAVLVAYLVWMLWTERR
ncbi:MAG TPA: hypothetical protein VJ997_04505 [Longimicrobiales bacterium]|nr:hypothetical protein [Longimicrobiales bacterium]